METWALNTFEANWDGNLIIYMNDDGALTTVNASVFSGDAFKSITTTPPTYAELSALPIAQQGWQKVFDQWKEKGYIV